MYLIAGLGNPGDKYKKTFHNMGFLAAEDAATELGVKFKKTECKAITCEAHLNGEKVIIAKPQTFMNLSGESLKELIGKYKVPLENTVVIYDDYDLTKGSLRLRAGGGTGTHNGMRNIVAELGSGDFKRIRVGIRDGQKDNIPIMNYVLSEIRSEDCELFAKTLKDAAMAALEFAKGVPFELVMQKYNKVYLSEEQNGL